MLAFLLWLSCASLLIAPLWGDPMYVRCGHRCPTASWSGLTLAYGRSVALPVESVCASHSYRRGSPAPPHGADGATVALVVCKRM